MDTPCSTQPFSVIFTHVFQNGSREDTEVQSFVEHLSDWDEAVHVYTEIRENVNLELRFQCDDSGARCYMDGFDGLGDDRLLVDQESEESYLGCDGMVTLFRHSTSDNYYPYIPGLYSLRVETSDGRTFYTLVKVISNRLFDDQLATMRSEVEEKLKGVALEVIRKQHSPKSLAALRIDPKLFRQYQMLQHYFTDIYAIVSDLAQRVRSSVSREYQMQPAEMPAHVDVVSIQHRLKRPDTMNLVKSVQKRINYDLPENQMLKAILEKWNQLLHEFVACMDTTIKGLSSRRDYSFSISLPLERKRRLVEELKEYRGKAMRMSGALNLVKSSHWYREVSYKKALSVPMVMFVDVRYRKLYQIDQALQGEEIPVHTALGQQWKRTDQLYEIWGWLQVVDVFGKRGSGEPGERGSLVTTSKPVAKDNMIQYQFGDISLHITYDGTIPSHPEATDKWTVPVYTTGTNNNPDVRMDLFLQEIYIGTIMIDMKYRKRHALTDSMRQLTSYADNVRSPYIYGKKRWQKYRPVHQVLVFYPEKHGGIEVEELDGKSISFVPLTPAEDQTVFQETLRWLVAEMLLEAEEEGIQ
ncbi:DUF2357 domain-containing protein [Sutcliffiella horikoshii]|uniref:DUF2357 domain-containing protein n=1 Tax=Sutcliffiella horikoshii TaxID=79883 RepID=A0A5D4T012_9BACI|nr:DUF2357 domain-containing protein [Sutcliffiella horikoshii]TYS67604.1 DUF2357 domain-containing protein [Sutcliffiella horikoshii]